jgi:hypothetical protein
MKKNSFIFLISTLLISTNLLAQEIDSIQQKHLTHLKKELSINDAKAKQVDNVLNDYKTKAKALSANPNLSQEEKRKQFDALIESKNSKLAKLSTEQQLKKIVPSSEREKTNNHN